MDPLTSLSMATSIIQIAELGCKLTKQGYQIFKKGSTDRNDELEQIAEGIKNLTLALGASLTTAFRSSTTHSLRQEEMMLQSLAEKTATVAGKLIHLLDSARIMPGTRQKWKAGGKILKALLDQPKIDNLVEALETYRNELVLRVVVSLKLNADLNSAREDVRFNVLEEESRKIVEALLSNKSYFTTGFDSLQEGQQNEAEKARIRHEETIAAIATLQGPSRGDESLSDALKKQSLQDLGTIQQEILDFLWFQYMRNRREEISTTYQSTFSWTHLTAHDSDNTPRYSFPSWLAEGDGIYWINGKAGSGKSTFMKYITAEPLTSELLRQWAGESSLLCASYFFWAAGTTLQQSQEGLLRSILYESLSTHPELIPVVFPEHSRLFARKRLQAAEPSLVELKEAFRILVSQDTLPLCICFYVDGIDEFNGDHVELVQSLRSTTSPRVKFVLSSRPTPSCVAAFSSCPTFRLQDFTRPDIQDYVAGILKSEPSILAMTQSFDSEVGKLIQDVVNKASGVFLWVVLVVKALITAATNSDSIADLRKRVDELPADIDKLYWNMLAQMDPSYRAQAAMMLQIMYRSSRIPHKKPMTSLRLSFAMDGIDAAIDTELAPLLTEEMTKRSQTMRGIIRSRSCGLIELHSTPVPNNKAWDNAGDNSYVENMLLRTRPHSRHENHVGTHTQGASNAEARGNDDVPAFPVEVGFGVLDEALLRKFHAMISSTAHSYDSWTCKTPTSASGVTGMLALEMPEVREEVQFLHKSVVDFLEQPQVWEELQEYLSGSPEFDANAALAAATLREIKGMKPEFDRALPVDSHNRPSPIWEALEMVLEECKHTEKSTKQSQCLLLEEIDATMDSHWRQIGGWRPNFGKSLEEMKHWSYHFDCGKIRCDSLFSIACLFGLEYYVQEVLEGGPAADRLGPTQDATRVALSQSALEHILTNTARSEMAFPWRILDLCLERGADVNRPFYQDDPFSYEAEAKAGKSLWQVALTRCYPQNLAACEDWSMLLSRLVDVGADVTTGLTEIEIFSDSDGSGDFRISRLPLEILRERFSAATKGQTRASARKTRLVFEKLRRRLVERGGTYGYVVEEEVVANKRRSSRPIKDPELAARIWNLSELGKFSWY